MSSSSESQRLDEPRNEAARKRRRVFFALWPHDEFRSALEHASRKHVRASGGAAIAARNLHVTLEFLGSIDAAALDRAREAARAVDAARFTLELDQLESWPRQHLLCLVPSAPNDSLHDFVRQLRRELEARDFELERRPFRPHVTLVRKVERPRIRATVDLPAWHIDEFALVESRTKPEGSEYEVLERFALGAA